MSTKNDIENKADEVEKKVIETAKSVENKVQGVAEEAK